MSVSAPIMQADSPLRDLQAAIVPALREALNGIAEIVDHVPEGKGGPYVMWDTAWLASRDGLNYTADRVWVQISCWSEYRGFKEVADVADKVIERLSHARVVMPGWDVTHILREQEHLTRDVYPRWRRAAITFNLPYVSLLRTPKED